MSNSTRKITLNGDTALLALPDDDWVRVERLATLARKGWRVWLENELLNASDESSFPAWIHNRLREIELLHAAQQSQVPDSGPLELPSANGVGTGSSRYGWKPDLSVSVIEREYGKGPAIALRTHSDQTRIFELEPADAHKLAVELLQIVSLIEAGEIPGSD